MSAALPDGVELHALEPHHDERGVFTELFRDEWNSATEPVQWNVVRSVAGVLRGVHVHVTHHDYLVVVDGSMVLGLCDLRPQSPSHGAALTLELRSDEPQAVAIPPGVAHGFYFPEASIHVYAVSHYWDLADELGCRWDDPDLAIPWSHQEATIAPRDAQLPPLSELVGQLAALSE
ncbi:MAG: dTDP-4-dehydrorhamnose 3,5-epimerase family protein [Solirubrobacterales bacterium]|nr:dTDP-4-dehydrorhamnose 3,5-epimerase family protein [Solirubrobacterales bacterium]